MTKQMTIVVIGSLRAKYGTQNLNKYIWILGGVTKIYCWIAKSADPDQNAPLECTVMNSIYLGEVSLKSNLM